MNLNKILALSSFSLFILLLGIFSINRLIDADILDSRSPFLFINEAQAASAGDLIKMDGLSSVYYLGDDNKRYVFPSESVYFSWYRDFKSVITVTAENLQSYPLGGNVTMRAGTKLVKITTDPAVYAVEPGGVLRKIRNENQARQLFGDAWANRVSDVPDAFFTDYLIGEELGEAELPAGTLVKANAQEAYFYFDGDSYRQIPSANTFHAHRFYSEYIIESASAISSHGSPLQNDSEEILTLIKDNAKIKSNANAQGNSNNNNNASSGNTNTGGSSGGGGGGGGGGGSTPVCSGEYTQSCSIANGQGTQARTCSSGTWSSWGTCTLNTCNTGFAPNGNICEAVTCSGESSQSCSINNGAGNQTRTCSLGSWSSWGACTLTSCNAGFQPSGNTCVALECTGSTSQSCSITNGTGTQNRTCNLGTWSGWGTCALVSCNSGFVQSGNTCVASGGSLELVYQQRLIHDQSFAIPSNAVNGDVVGHINNFWPEWDNKTIGYSLLDNDSNFSIDGTGKLTLTNSSALSGQSTIVVNVQAQNTAEQRYENAVISIRVLPAADTYYIDPTVAVSGNGTRENPYKNWSNVTIAANKNYLQKRGTAAVISSRIHVSQNNVLIGAYGSANARPILTAHNITGSSNGAFGIYGNNNTVRDLDIDAMLSTSGIYIGSSTNVTVDNCRIQNSEWALRTMTSGDGTKILNSELAYIGDDGHYNQNHNNMEIAYNYIHHVNQKWNENSYWYEGKDESSSPGDSIQLNGSAFGFNIHHNIMDRSDTGNKFCVLIGLIPSPTNTNGRLEHNYCQMGLGTQGFYVERGAVGVKVRYNTFKDGRGLFTHATDLNVSYNLFLNSRAYFGEPEASYVVYNNVFYDTAAGSYSITMWRDHLDMRNNIFFFTNETAIGLQSSSPNPLITGHNLYYPNFRGAGSSSTNIIADPQFVNPAAGDFRLQVGSPAISAGVNVGETHDFYGNTLTNGYNIGLWQN